MVLEALCLTQQSSCYLLYLLLWQFVESLVLTKFGVQKLFFFSGYSVEKRSFLLFFIITKCPSLKLITHCFCSESLNFCTDIFSLDVLLSAALQVMTSQELHIILFLKLHKKWQKYQLCSIQFNDFNVHRSSCSATLKNRTVLANSPFITNFKLG